MASDFVYGSLAIPFVCPGASDAFDDADPANVCLIFADGFESGATNAWSATVQ